MAKECLICCAGALEGAEPSDIKRMIQSSSLLARASRYKKRSALTESLLGAFCVETCARQLGVLAPIVTSESSKPHSEQLSFNVSHSAGLAVCIAGAADTGELGIDVEVLRSQSERPLRRRIADRYFSANEIVLLESHDCKSYELEFIKLWTAHEALGKQLGVGIFKGDAAEYAHNNSLLLKHYILKIHSGAIKARPYCCDEADDITAGEYVVCICIPNDVTVSEIISTNIFQ